MTVKELRRKLFKRNIQRVRRFFALSRMEFDRIFIDGEPDGCLYLHLERAGYKIEVMICRNGQEPEIFCLNNRTIEEELNRAYKDLCESLD